MAEPAPELAIRGICNELATKGRKFAVVGGLAVSVRAEVRFTRDVDVAISVVDDQANSANNSNIYLFRHEKTQHALTTKPRRYGRAVLICSRVNGRREPDPGRA